MTYVYTRDDGIVFEGPGAETFYNSLNRMNRHNVHAWVVRDGEIVDNLFGEFDGKDIVYAQLNSNLQKYFHTICIKPFLQLNYEKYIPSDEWCNFNSINEIKKNGGEIVYGCLGYKEDGRTVWAWGNPNFKTYRDFITVKV